MILPEDVLVHAQYLYAHKEKTEILMRNVVRSAYYALYHKLLNLELPELDDDEKKCGLHVQLIKKLKKSMIEEYSTLGTALADLKFTRVKADYYLKNPLTKREAYKSLRTVEKIFKSMNENETEQVIKAEGNIETIASKPIVTKRPTLKVIKGSTKP